MHQTAPALFSWATHYSMARSILFKELQFWFANLSVNNGLFQLRAFLPVHLANLLSFLTLPSHAFTANQDNNAIKM